MTKRLKVVYKRGLDDAIFNDEMRNIEEHPENYKKPGWLDNEAIKICYAAMYLGWLRGKGKITREEYVQLAN